MSKATWRKSLFRRQSLALFFCTNLLTSSNATDIFYSGPLAPHPHTTPSPLFLRSILSASNSKNPAEPLRSIAEDHRREDHINRRGGLSPHKPLWPLDWRDWSAAAICFVLLLACGAAGFSGGAFTIPVFWLLLDFSLPEVLGLSYATLFGGSTAILFFNVGRRVEDSDSSKNGNGAGTTSPLPLLLVDWSTILLVEPATIGGALVGYFLRMPFPSWILHSVAALIWGLVVVNYFLKARKRWKQEEKEKTESGGADARRGLIPTVPTEDEDQEEQSGSAAEVVADPDTCASPGSDGGDRAGVQGDCDPPHEDEQNASVPGPFSQLAAAFVAVTPPPKWGAVTQKKKKRRPFSAWTKFFLFLPLYFCTVLLLVGRGGGDFQPVARCGTVGWWALSLMVGTGGFSSSCTRHLREQQQDGRSPSMSWTRTSTLVFSLFGRRRCMVVVVSLIILERMAYTDSLSR